jgi:hypothetical protein
MCSTLLCAHADSIQVLGSRQTQEDRHAIAKLGTLTFDKSLACFAVYDGQYVRYFSEIYS